MRTITGYRAQGLLSHIKDRTLGHPYISKPHPVFAYLQETGDCELLLRYAQEQPPISHQFLIALGELALNIIRASREKSTLFPKVAEAAFYVAKNLSEELNDPQAHQSHVGLLGDLQRAIAESMGINSEEGLIHFTRSPETVTYEEAMTRGMTNTRTGLLYLAVMETWMGPEYDILEIAATKGGIPRERQFYFDANRDADEDHVVISVQGALSLAEISPETWNVSMDEVNALIEQSSRDRAAFWDQFTLLLR